MPRPILEIASPKSNIAQCSSSPQLMPFHVSYTGPAPISTFFRVHEQNEPSFAGRESDSSSETVPKVPLRKRLTSAFRGRQIVATDVILPSGYTGLILRSETSTRPNPKPLPSSKARNFRGSRRSKAIVIENEPEECMDIDEDLMKSDVDDERETKRLQPVQTFDAIRFWNADNSIDEGRDEYIRALRDWTTLAATVHQIEDD